MIVAALIAIALVTFAVPAGAAPAKARNVVLIVGDDMGYADLGVHGGSDVVTPNIDSLATHGVRFTNAYVSAAQCSPSRAGLLTGRYQQRFGHEFNLSPQTERFGLPLGETTLADRMKAAGYATAVIGKWHLGTEPRYHPSARGFDEFFGFLKGAHSYVPDSPEPLFRGTTPIRETEYLTDAFGREAVSFITAQKEKPFFLYVAFNAVHTPLSADAARLARFADIADQERRIYAAALFAMDEAIGRVLATLRATKRLDDTLVVFLNDNGGPTMRGVTVNGAVNRPLRGSKRTTLEGGVRVPFLMQWPARLRPGQVVDQPVIQLDLLPTILAAIGVETKPEWKLDGVDLLPHLTGAASAALPPPHDTLFWRFGSQMAIRQGDWKLVRYDLAVEGGRGTSAAKLYDLRHDVGEATDLAARHPDRVQELQHAWDRWNTENVPPLWNAAER
jgi:arylsulfatase A-like enzyme